MSKCDFCGTETNFISFGPLYDICDDCKVEIEEDKVDQILKDLDETKITKERRP